jgi:F-type H+-transporting ATPase subunit epsilon
MARSFQAEVVAADSMVWEGPAVQVVAMTTEGEIGVLADHIPLIATLAPGSAEVTTESGERKVVAVDGGFLSVSTSKVAIISPYARLVRELSLDEAEKELRQAQAVREAGDSSEATRRRIIRALAQVKAATRSA